jgi:hypothetical protein
MAAVTSTLLMPANVPPLKQTSYERLESGDVHDEVRRSASTARWAAR